ncbi:head GIN domain-containing protein [Paucibacter sp. APW11]|uniref:Head GIN domain-containing protein n=1 Tax=Roseateles aquae TaxID=3077235 RepID=A0ABU3PEF2_9BURK|nr:head GIN domain-containing protein [Paucibacter sp. APW11]MDT9000975.1 head GIN domain-containing protein [Paucibacter sp. APW11]
MKPSQLCLATATLSLLTALMPAAWADSVDGRTYAPGPFERLEIAGTAQVKLSQGSKDEVFIAGDADVQKGVQVELIDDKLFIRPTGGWKFWRSARLQVEVMMRNLSQLVLSGAADVNALGPVKTGKLAVSISGAGLARFDDLNAEQLQFNISGAGDGRLRGQVGDLRLYVSGKGKLQADQLHCDRAAVSISGIGNASLWVSESLSVSVSGLGTVDYWGQPEVRRAIAGLASINAHGDKR